MINMRENIFFVGLGQAGGNLYDAFEEEGGGYTGIAINSSLGDLNTLKFAKQKYHLLAGEGANHDRDKSKALIVANIDGILERIMQCITPKIKTILVMSSTGGGTGSGSAPALVSLLVAKLRQANMNINVGMVAILPAETESFKIQYNTLMFFEDLKKVKNSGAIFLLDNNTIKNKMNINKKFVKQFSAFIDIPRLDHSIKKTIDPNEIVEVLSAKKIAMITTVPYRKKQNIVDDILQSFSQNIYAERDVTTQFGYVVLSLADKQLIYDDVIVEMKKNLGQSIDDYVTDNNRGVTVCCLSGLPFPTKRIDKISQAVKNNSANIKNLLTNEDEINDIDDSLKTLFTSTKKKTDDNDNLTSILNGFL